VALTAASFGAEAVLERRGCALRYWLRDAAGPDAPLVMLIHGAGVDHRMWASQLDAFAENHRVLTFDMRGHGKSRPAGEYSFDALVDDGFALLDRLKARKVALLGLSMGGNVAQEMVFRDAERFAGRRLRGLRLQYPRPLPRPADGPGLRGFARTAPWPLFDG
jgi:pimeloyl-ACP methyl ester carboxylesterase